MSFTTDGGVNWTTDARPPTNTISARHLGHALSVPHCSDYSYASIVSAQCHNSWGYGNSDSLVVAWSRTTTPDVWEDRNVVNDYKATGQHHHCGDMIDGTGGHAVAYAATVRERFGSTAGSTTQR